MAAGNRLKVHNRAEREGVYDAVQHALCEAEDPFTYRDVEAVALAMFHSYDSESALDWYEHRKRLEPQARRMLEEVQR